MILLKRWWWTLAGLVPDRLTCLLAGHDDRQEAGHGEVFLRCARCWRRTAGWQVKDVQVVDDRLPNGVKCSPYSTT